MATQFDTSLVHQKVRLESSIRVMLFHAPLSQWLAADMDFTESFKH